MEEPVEPTAVVFDACTVASAAVLFTLALVDSTFDQSSGPVANVTSPLLVLVAFKHSSVFTTACRSLLFPLVVLRLVQVVTDAMQLAEAAFARRAVWFLDTLLFALTAANMTRVRQLELDIRGAQGALDTPWGQAVVLGLRDAASLAYLAQLALTGLLVVTSLMKLAARAEQLKLESSSAALAAAAAAAEDDDDDDDDDDAEDDAPADKELSKASGGAPSAPSEAPVAVEVAHEPPPAPPASELATRGWQRLTPPPEIPDAPPLPPFDPAPPLPVQIAVGACTFVAVFAALKRLD